MDAREIIVRITDVQGVASGVLAVLETGQLTLLRVEGDPDVVSAALADWWRSSRALELLREISGEPCSWGRVEP